MEQNVANKQTILRGTVVFLPMDIGSKSEAVMPLLYITREKKIRLFKKDDNPFENCSFDDYDGKVVEVQGELIRENKLEVQNIKIINKVNDDEMSKL